MLQSRSIRWAGKGISNGRQRLISGAGTNRNFSINASRSYTLRVTRLSPSSPRHSSLQQTRSLSLFGWGGSSKPSSDSASTSVSDIEIGPNSAGLDNVRTVKASLATSDAPAPPQAHLHPPNNLEPQFIENLQETITLPHGDAAERIAEITSGEADISSAHERLGYLKEVCGLDFGWGPSTMMENLLEWLHVGAGLSWTASIVAVATILRVAMIWPMIGSQQQGKKMREMQPYMLPLRTKYTTYMQEGNRAKAAEMAAQMKELTKSYGVSYTKAFVPLLIQLPFSFGAFRVLRNAGQLPVPAFVTEDWLWTTDLSFSDPYYITPAVSAAMIWLSLRAQQNSPNAMMGPQMMKIFTTALPAMSFLFMSFQPGSVQLYFVTTGIWAYGTTTLLRQKWFRDFADLGPLPGAPAPTITSTQGSTSKPSQTTSKPLPANIQRIAPIVIPVQAPTPTVEQPAADRSAIDRAVDGVKGKWKDMTKGATQEGFFGKKLAQTQKDQKTAAAARYHAQRQIQLNREREERNQQAQEK